MKLRAYWIHRLLIVYLILQSPASGLVLCWGDHGHLAVEISSPGNHSCCGSQICDGESVYVDDAAQPPSSSCQSCWDLPLAIQAHSDVNAGARLNVGDKIADIDFIETPIHPCAFAADERPPNPHFMPPFILPSLQSVRLLI